VLEKSGTWLSYNGERIGQGRENGRLFLKENKDIREKLESALRKKLGIGPANNANAANAPNGANGANGAAAGHGPNGHAAPAANEKPPVKAAAAAASSSDAGKRPSR
jgi:recombination protein RecA